MKRRLVTVMILVLAVGGLAIAGQPPGTPAAQDGFVPVDAPLNAQDAMPAPRLVAIAYGFIWLVLFGYVASVKTRLSGVEREMNAISRRVASGSK